MLLEERIHSLLEQILSFKRSSHMKMDENEENRCLLQWSPFDVINFLSVLATPLSAIKLAQIYNVLSYSLCSFIQKAHLYDVFSYSACYIIQLVTQSSVFCFLSPVISDIQYAFRRGPVRIQCTQILFVPSYLKYRATQSAELSTLLSCQKSK